MIEQKPYALSCDKNGPPILDALEKILQGRKSLLEVGAGTGQHAIFMAPHFLEMTWTLSDQQERLEGISLWLRDFPRANIRGPVVYQIGENSFPSGEFDVVFTANTLHIISWPLCLQFFKELGDNLKAEALFITYGAFNYGGEFTSESNRTFDKWLKDRDTQSGVRNFEDVRDELEKVGFESVEDITMPANNRLLVFKKK